MFNFFSNKNPQEGAIALMQGDKYLSQGDYRNAIVWHNQAIEKLPNNANILENAYWSRGLAYMSLDNLNDALKDFNKAINSNPKYLIAYTSRAECYSRLQNWKNAIGDFEKALTLQYDYWHQVATHQLEKAEIISQKQIKYEIHLGAAMAYNHIIDFKNCLKHFEAAYEIHPTFEISNYIQQVKERIAQLGW